MDNLYAVSFASLDGTFFVMLLSANDEKSAVSKALSYLNDKKTYDFVNSMPVSK